LIASVNSDIVLVGHDPVTSKRRVNDERPVADVTICVRSTRFSDMVNDTGLADLVVDVVGNVRRSDRAHPTLVRDAGSLTYRSTVSGQCDLYTQNVRKGTRVGYGDSTQSLVVSNQF